MTDPGVQSRPNSDEMCGQSLSLKQSDWMGHWLHAKYKRPAAENATSHLMREGGHETKGQSTSCTQIPEPSGIKSVNGARQVAEGECIEVMNKFMTNGSKSKKERSDLSSFPMFGVLQNVGNKNGKQVLSSDVGTCKEPNAVAIGSNLPSVATLRGSKIQPKESAPNLELELGARESTEGGIVSTLRSSHDNLSGMPSGFPYGIMYRQGRVPPYASTSKEPFTHHSTFHEYNIETMRVSSTMDAREDSHSGLPMYAATTRHFFITEATAVGVLDESHIFRDSMLSTKLDGNLGGLISLAPAFGQVLQGVQLQILNGSTDSELKEIANEENHKEEGRQSIGRLEPVASMRNETSAETRTMEVDTSLDNYQTYDFAISGVNKDVLRGQSNVSSQGKSPNTELPDMNEEAQGLDDFGNEVEQSTSKTQSLDMDCLLSHGDLPVSSKPGPSHFAPMESEPGSRWVKRLKLGGSNSALGTKSSPIEEEPSHEKLRKFSSKFLFHSKGLTSSEPMEGTFLKRNLEHNKIDEVSNHPNLGEVLKKDRDTLLSHSWIRRWCHDKPALLSNQPGPVDPSQSHSPKVTFDNFQNKSFPSIAAMALMGKAMNGFRPCEFTNKGSFIVWNTNSVPSD